VTNMISDDDLFYKSHVFFCTNERPDGHPRGCCKARGSEKLRNYMKAKAKALGLDRIRINSAGCLDRCELGPVLVIYPEGVWYKCQTTEDVDRVLEQHIQKGNRINDLMLGAND